MSNATRIALLALSLLLGSALLRVAYADDPVILRLLQSLPDGQ